MPRPIGANASEELLEKARMSGKFFNGWGIYGLGIVLKHAKKMGAHHLVCLPRFWRGNFYCTRLSEPRSDDKLVRIIRLT